MQELLNSLDPNGVALIQGAIVSFLVAIFGKLGGTKWAGSPAALKQVVVALVATAWAGLVGWKLMGLAGAALVAHVVSAFVGAVGTHQTVKKLAPVKTVRHAAGSLKTKITARKR